MFLVEVTDQGWIVIAGFQEGIVGVWVCGVGCDAGEVGERGH